MTVAHDQDVLRAIKSQAKIGETPISEFQIEHVYDIGRRSQRERLEAAQKLVDAVGIYYNSPLGLPPSVVKAYEGYVEVVSNEH